MYDIGDEVVITNAASDFHRHVGTITKKQPTGFVGRYEYLVRFTYFGEPGVWNREVSWFSESEFVPAPAIGAPERFDPVMSSEDARKDQAKEEKRSALPPKPHHYEFRYQQAYHEETGEYAMRTSGRVVCDDGTTGEWSEFYSSELDAHDEAKALFEKEYGDILDSPVDKMLREARRYPHAPAVNKPPTVESVRDFLEEQLHEYERSLPFGAEHRRMEDDIVNNLVTEARIKESLGDYLARCVNDAHFIIGGAKPNATIQGYGPHRSWLGFAVEWRDGHKYKVMVRKVKESC